MEILISVDIEGVAGVTERVQQSKGNPEYEFARRLMTGEANAAARGAFAAGADKVTIVDSHGSMCNMICEDLHPEARLISGKPRPFLMIEGVHEGCAGIVLIGWHARAGAFGQFAHTISSAAFRSIAMNGVGVGEATLFAGYAASLGVPFLATSGDNFYEAEIADQFPDTRFIRVKDAVGAYSANSLSPEKSRRLIEDGVKEAVSNIGRARPSSPIALPLNAIVELRSQHLADCATMISNIKREAAETVSFVSEDWASAIQTLAAISLMVPAAKP